MLFQFYDLTQVANNQTQGSAYW